MKAVALPARRHARASTPRAIVRSARAWRWAALALGGLSLALALAGEGLTRANDRSPLGLAAYLIAIALFAISTPTLAVARWAAAPDQAASGARSSWRTRALIGAAACLILATWLAGLRLIYADLGSPLGGALWLGSMALLVVVGVAARRELGWSPRWATSAWPDGRRDRRLLVAALVGVIVLAAATRLLFLDRIPLGINADEGDRAAMSIQILRGTAPRPTFSFGWYWVPMIYFWLVAQVMAVIGIGFAQARVLGALAGVLSVAAVTWLGMRQFGVRAGLIAGGILSCLGVALQFSRETSEAGPTGALWAVSVACFLEAARRGRPWAWIGAGLAGGFSLYFYSSARLWAIVAVCYAVYLIARAPAGGRPRVLGGVALAATAALMAAGPFLAMSMQHPEVLFLRAAETSIFTKDNVTRLPYVEPSWSTARLVLEQLVRSVGLFNQFPDEAGFWPTKQPVLPAGLAVLTLLGLGWATVRWRDPRLFGLALWFWLGLAGVVVTVETPNLQRMAAAVPVLALFPALVLDEMAKRVERVVRAFGRTAWVARHGATVAVGAIAVGLMGGEGWYYFHDYAAIDRWPQPTVEGQAVRDQGADTLVVSLGRSANRATSGWVRLLASNTPKAEIEHPGADLPFAVPARHGLAILLPPRQAHYLPYLEDLYPAGSAQPYTHATEGLVLTMLRVAPADVPAVGALAARPGEEPRVVPTLGAMPQVWGPSAGPARWTARLRVPRYWNYSFRVGPGPARLTIDGVEVLAVGDGAPAGTASVALARGEHAVVYDGVADPRRGAATLAWAPAPRPSGNDSDPRAEPTWRPIPTEAMLARAGGPVGLFGVLQVEGEPEQHVLDRTVVTCCLSRYLTAEGRPYSARWTGSLHAAWSGTYEMALAADGVVELRIDGQTAVRGDSARNEPATGQVALTAGTHAVELVFRSAGESGDLEWSWTPPGRRRSVVPPSALTPPIGAGVGAPLPASALVNGRFAQPEDAPLRIIR